MKPNFLIIGAARSGTTSLFQYLENHPDVFMSEVKELNFFSNPKFWKKGTKWYEENFKKATQKAVGEASTSYTRHPSNPDVAERIHGYNPEMKLIYILRDPVDRFISHYLHHVTRGQETRSLDELFQGTLDDPSFWQGKYHYQLREYLRYFSQSNIHIVTIDQLKNQPTATVESLFNFLSVTPQIDDSKLSQHHNANSRVTQKSTFGMAVLSFYHKYIEQRPFPYRLKRRFLKLAEFGSKTVSNTSLSASQHKKLVELYQPDVEKLKHDFGVDTKHWKNFK